MSQTIYPNIFDFQKDFEPESSLLGQGTFGAVYKMKSKREINSQKPGTYYAIKMMEAKSQSSFQQIQKEFLMLRVLPSHQGIVKMVKCYAWQKTQPLPQFFLTLVMELQDRSMQQEIDRRRQNNQELSEKDILYVFHQCIQAFHFLAKQKIYHRDIKPQNLMFTNPDSLEIKITDFGVSRKLHEEKMSLIPGTLVGTPVYLSPILWSALERGEFDIDKIGKIKHNFEKSDIYSLGVTFLQFTLTTTDVAGLNKSEGGQQKTQKLTQNIQSHVIRDMIRGMLEHEEDDRYSYSQLLNYFQPKIQLFPRTKTPEQSNENQKLQRFNSSEQNETKENTKRYLSSIKKLPPQIKSDFTIGQQYSMCQYHKDQIIKFYCYSPDFNNYICDLCFNQLNKYQSNYILTLPELSMRIKQDKFKTEIEQNLSVTKQNLKEFEIKMKNYLFQELNKYVEDLERQLNQMLQIAKEKVLLEFNQINVGLVLINLDQNIMQTYSEHLEKINYEQSQLNQVQVNQQDLNLFQKIILKQNSIFEENNKINQNIKFLNLNMKEYEDDVKMKYLIRSYKSLQEIYRNLEIKLKQKDSDLIEIENQKTEQNECLDIS